MTRKLLKESDINTDEVFELASIGCTQAEIAQKFGISINVLMHNYKYEYYQGIAMMHEKLRRAQFECAYNKKGDATMLIFLGKIYLNQKERAEDDKAADIDILLKIVEDQAKCLSSPENNSKALANQTQE